MKRHSDKTFWTERGEGDLKKMNVAMIVMLRQNARALRYGHVEPGMPSIRMTNATNSLNEMVQNNVKKHKTGNFVVREPSRIMNR